MEKMEEDYNGFWKQLGCWLSVIAILAIILIFVLGFYMLFNGF